MAVSLPREVDAGNDDIVEPLFKKPRIHQPGIEQQVMPHMQTAWLSSVHTSEVAAFHAEALTIAAISIGDGDEDV